MLMHSLVSNRFTPLLNLTFKFRRHKVLLNDYTFSFHDCVALIWLLSVSIYFVLVWINTIISRFSTLINFLILLIRNHVNIYRLFVTSSNILILTLIPSINSTYSIYTSSTDSILISFLILNQSS
jgi:hypothetical protein